MNKIVTSYVNPDLDGVACVLAVTSFDPQWRAAILGDVDAETSAVLRLLEIECPKSITNWDGIEEIWLVDTHHAKQLPPDLPHHLVRRITDHHPAGDLALYAGAEIENEKVGAAATLIAERFERSGRKPTVITSLLLQAAILSNTLELGAPSTSDRDRGAIRSLSSIARLSEDIVVAMGEARRGILALSTDELLLRDAKVFDTPHGVIAIAQMEAPGALELLLRADLFSAMDAFAKRRGSDSAILSVVDTGAGRGAIVVTNARIAELLRHCHLMARSDDPIIRFERLIQRKTDILPYIAKT